jgi:hypothetical protein
MRIHGSSLVARMLGLAWLFVPEPHLFGQGWPRSSGGLGPRHRARLRLGAADRKRVAAAAGKSGHAAHVPTRRDDLDDLGARQKSRSNGMLSQYPRTEVAPAERSAVSVTCCQISLRKRVIPIEGAMENSHDGAGPAGAR